MKLDWIGPFHLMAALVVVATPLFQGCETTRSAHGDSNAVLSAASRLHDEQISKLTFQVNQLKEDRAALAGKVETLSRRVARLESRLVLLSKEMAALNSKIAAEAAARKRDDDLLLKRVAKQVAAVVNASRPAPRPVPRPAASSTGEFYEYTVEPGATLSAIAKAYKVTVSEIKRANKLKSDNIRVGQKLLIPKKR
jgi:LysM repeat protein